MSTPNLRPVPDEHGDEDEADPRDGPAPRYVLANGPANLAWLRSELGAARLPGVFVRDQCLVYVASIGEGGYIAPRRAGEDNGPATIVPLNKLSLSTRIGDRFEVMKMTEGTKSEKPTPKPAFFPVDVCARTLETVDELPYVRPLVGVTHTPIARADKGLLTEPGYDETSGYLYEPTVEVGSVIERPTSTQVQAATTFLRGLVEEFVWSDTTMVDQEGNRVPNPDASSEANFWGAMLTPLLRLACPPPYKLVGITARERGSGKSLLAKMLRIVHGGGLSTWPADDAELEKFISSTLYCTTSPIVQIDNVRGTLASARLEALSTSSTYQARILGSTNKPTLINDRLWCFTGNNMIIGGDLGRRMLWIDIDPGVARPELRNDFAINDLADYVARHRGRVLRALLTWIAAWDADGRPIGQATSDDYGRWTATVRSILEIAGVPGVFDHVDSVRDEVVNPSESEWGEFLAEVHAQYGEHTWTVRELTELMAAVDVSARAQGDRLRDALPTSLNEMTHRPAGPRGIRRSLGMWLTHRKGQWHGDLTVWDMGLDASKSRRWQIKSMPESSPGSPGGHPDADESTS